MTDAEEWQEIKRVMGEALSLEHGNRAEYLAQLAARAPELHREVASLISAHEANSSFLETPYIAVAEALSAPDAQTGRLLGAYRLLEMIGEGGMGTVYRAVRADGTFERQVAVKMIRGGLAGDFFLSRFNNERQILARLNHPNIAGVLDGGATEDGVPYLVMEFVGGVPIDEYCTARQLSIPERLRLFREVCSAVQYAHQNLIVHRDLKPGNVLVTPNGQTKLLDFGIAKILEPGDAAARDQGLTVIPIMTPDFASPEQVRGEAITTASDVYALGVVLYVLLTGQRPYRTAFRPVHEVMRAICDTEPPRPSVALWESSRLVQRGAQGAPRHDQKRLRRAIRGDLDSIVMKAMRKLPAERYATVDHLSADVGRYLDGRPVLARRGTNAYRLRKFVARHAAGVVVTAGVAAALLGSMLISLREAHEAQAQSAQKTEAQSRLLTESAAARLKDGDIAGAEGVILEVLTDPEFAQARAAAAISVFQETRAAESELAILVGHGNFVICAAFSPDGTRIATASSDKTVRLWDAETGALITILSGHTGGVRSAAFSPDGTHILTASADKTARIWDALTGAPLAVLSGHSDALRTAAYSPDGARIVTASWDHTVRIWDARTGAPLAVFSGHASPVFSAAYSPDGTRIVTASTDKTARIWNARTGAAIHVLSGHSDFVQSAVYSPDGTRILTASADKTARIWDARTGASMMILSGHGHQVNSATYSRDGGRILTASADTTVRIWDARTGAVLGVLAGHGDYVQSAAYSPDGTRIVSASQDKTARVWDARTDAALTVLHGHDNYVSTAAYSPDGSRIVTASWDKTARIWDARTGVPGAVLSGHSGAVNAAAYSPDGTHIVTGSYDASARVWDARTGGALAVFSGLGGEINAVAYSPDGTRIVIASFDKTVHTLDARTGAPVARLSGHSGTMNYASYSADGSRIVTASDDKTARIWDTRTGATLAVLAGHQGGVQSAAYSPDGTRIVTASQDKTALIWDAGTGVRLAMLSGHHHWLTTAAFSPDGSRIVTASFDKTARIWDARTGVQLAVLNGHDDAVESAAYSPDGTRIVTASNDQTARIWDARIAVDLDAQIMWNQAAQFDPLMDVERARLGLSSDARVRVWSTDASECDRLAAAVYDPDRLAPGVAQSDITANVATAACSQELAKSGNARRLFYQAGRALLAQHDVKEARMRFDAAVADGYRAARVDLADLLVDPSAGMLEPHLAVSLYEHAWQDSVPTAAFALGRLYEYGLQGTDAAATLEPDPSKAWSWYRMAADAGEPNALARFAERDERDALTASSEPKKDALLLQAFGLYTAAAECAKDQGWPDGVWKNWRYRRATLARVLAREGMMQQVADAYQRTRDRWSPRRQTMLESIKTSLHMM